MAGHLPGRGFESLPEPLSLLFSLFLSLYFFPSHWLSSPEHVTLCLQFRAHHLPPSPQLHWSDYVFSSSLTARLCCTHLNLRNLTWVLFLIELPVLSSYNHWTLTTVQLPEMNINSLAKYVLHISLAGQTLTLEWWVEVSTCLFYWHGSQYISCPSHITLCGWDWVQRVI